MDHSTLSLIFGWFVIMAALLGWVWINIVIIKERYYTGKHSWSWFVAFNALGVFLGIIFLNTAHYYI